MTCLFHELSENELSQVIYTLNLTVVPLILGTVLFRSRAICVSGVGTGTMPAAKQKHELPIGERWRVLGG